MRTSRSLIPLVALVASCGTEAAEEPGEVAATVTVEPVQVVDPEPDAGTSVLEPEDLERAELEAACYAGDREACDRLGH